MTTEIAVCVARAHKGGHRRSDTLYIYLFYANVSGTGPSPDKKRLVRQGGLIPGQLQASHAHGCTEPTAALSVNLGYTLHVSSSITEIPAMRYLHSTFHHVAMPGGNIWKPFIIPIYVN